MIYHFMFNNPTSWIYMLMIQHCIFMIKNIEKINSILQNDLNAIQSWCNNNSMKINAQKTKCIKLSSKQKLTQLS